MPLDPQVKALMDGIRALGLPPVWHLSVGEARERLTAAFATKGTPEPVFDVRDVLIPCPASLLPVRVYTPSEDELLPVMVFFHGGGWTVNNLETHDSLCRFLANAVGCVVVAVDYRLAPEHKYPAAIDDAYLAVQWVANNAKRNGWDGSRIVVGGDSSGGTQAAVVSMLARDRGGPEIFYQWMAYPPTDYYIPGTASYDECATGYSLTRDWMIWFWNHYLPSDSDVSNPYISPLRASNLSGLPETFLMTAQYDPLGDEGEAFASRLADAGVSVSFQRYDGLMHGFLMQRGTVDRATRATNELASVLKRVLHTGEAER